MRIQTYFNKYFTGNASLYNVQTTRLKNLPDGTMDLQDLENHIRKPNLQEYRDHHDHHEHHDHEHHEHHLRREPTTRLVTIENTHRYSGGKVSNNY